MFHSRLLSRWAALFRIFSAGFSGLGVRSRSRVSRVWSRFARFGVEVLGLRVGGEGRGKGGGFRVIYTLVCAKLPAREAGSPNHHDDEVDSDQ